MELSYPTRASSGAIYVKSLSFFAHTFGRQSLKLLIVYSVVPVGDGRRRVTLVTCVTNVIAWSEAATPSKLQLRQEIAASGFALLAMTSFLLNSQRSRLQ